MLEAGQLKSVTDGDDDAKTILRAPTSFGDEALYDEDGTRVHASELTAWGGPASLLRFEASDIEALIGYGLQERVHRAHDRALLAAVTLHGTPLLSGLSEPEAEWVTSAAIHEPRYVAGKEVVREGECDEKLFVVRRGDAVVRGRRSHCARGRPGARAAAHPVSDACC